MLMLMPFLVASLVGVLSAKGATAGWEYAQDHLAGRYAIYGGYLGDPDMTRPVPGNTKVAFSVTGRPAKNLFDAIGPSGGAQASGEYRCEGRPDMVVRQRDALICRYRAKEGYWCTFGFDLSTGLSTPGTRSGGICSDTPP